MIIIIFTFISLVSLCIMFLFFFIYIFVLANHNSHIFPPYSTIFRLPALYIVFSIHTYF
ncbi:uncharacterized protein BYT42DRAFT_246687 [Radiomyces spectabilis]|uniref:uncharacterized protein n=1 Tax=Radiomyces spectabilis TaxID=64574 RepID=UPI0022201AEB|nr:uncharacterized protein BYT42DRAFT_246687 [Radiomyces spectabilis]KAI8388787.1 hypothetical protein BYT42DRAFT_246687 [Radiomyces spectabilis]